MQRVKWLEDNTHGRFSELWIYIYIYIFAVPENKSAGPKSIRLHERIKTLKQSVTNLPNYTTFIFYLNITTCFGLQRPSSGHYKNFKNKVKYSSFINHNMGYHTCYNNCNNVKLHNTT